MKQGLIAVNTLRAIYGLSRRRLFAHLSVLFRPLCLVPALLLALSLAALLAKGIGLEGNAPFPVTPQSGGQLQLNCESGRQAG